MLDSRSGKNWKKTVGDLTVVRQTSKSGGSTLSRLRLTNEGHETVATRIVEPLPEETRSTMLLTTTSDVTDAWRRVDDRVVNEFVVPPGQKRTAAFLVRSDVDPPLSLEPPKIRAIETTERDADVDELFDPIDDSSDDVDEPQSAAGMESNGWSSQPTTTDGGSPGSPSPAHQAADDESTGESGPVERSDEDSPASESGDGTRDPDVGSATGRTSGSDHDEPSSASKGSNAEASSVDRQDDEAGESTDDDDVELSETGQEDGNVVSTSTDGTQEAAESSPPSDFVDQLLTALRDEASPKQRRALRSELGASESEQLRLVHLESRLEEFAAYVDAFETILDVHGAEVVDEMHESIEENTTRTEALQEELEAIDDRLESYRSDADNSLAELERDLASLRVDHEERVSTIESTLEEMRSDVSSLQSQIDDDRQVQARALRRLDESVSQVETQVEELDADVQQGRAFRKRFTDALAPGQDGPDGEFPGADSDD